MSDDAEYVGVYDITNDRERSKVEKIFKAYGFRIQKSVFECRMRKGDRESLLARLEKAGIKTGFVKIYRLESRTRHPEVGDTGRARTDADAAYVVA